MEHLLKNGEITLHKSDSGNGGLTKEVHLLKHKEKKYILRICPNKKTAENYLNLYHKLKKYKFFPELLDSKGKYLLFEYLEGRDLEIEDASKYAFEIGKIVALITKIKISKNQLFNLDKKFFRKLTFITNKKILSKKLKEELTKRYKEYKRLSKIKVKIDLNDLSPSNFRLTKGKVYFVDIEAIKPEPRLYCIGKGFLKWFKKLRQRKKFLAGFNSIKGSKFLNKDELKFIYLYFLINNIYHKYERKDKSYTKQLKQINRLLENKLK